jgi:hypothetical protein
VTEPNAKIWVNGAYEGIAPVQTSVMRNSSVAVIAKKEGFENSIRVENSHLSTTGILDLIGGCVFLVPFLGFTSAGAFSLDETTLVMNLTPAVAPAPAAATNSPGTMK